MGIIGEKKHLIYEKISVPEIECLPEEEKQMAPEQIIPQGRDQNVPKQTDSSKWNWNKCLGKKNRRRLLLLISMLFICSLLFFIAFGRQNQDRITEDKTKDEIFRYARATIDGLQKGLIFQSNGNVQVIEDAFEAIVSENMTRSVKIAKKQNQNEYYVMTKDGANLAFSGKIKRILMDQDGNHIYYILVSKDGQNELYCYDIKEKSNVQIAAAEDLGQLHTSPDGDCLVYQQTGRNQISETILYQNKEKVNLGEQLNIICVSNQAECIYYLDFNTDLLMCRYQGKSYELGDGPKLKQKVMINYDHTELLFYRDRYTHFTKNGSDPHAVVKLRITELIGNYNEESQYGEGMVYGVRTFVDQAMRVGDRLALFNGSGLETLMTIPQNSTNFCANDEYFVTNGMKQSCVTIFKNYKDPTNMMQKELKGYHAYMDENDEIYLWNDNDDILYRYEDDELEIVELGFLNNEYNDVLSIVDTQYLIETWNGRMRIYHLDDGNRTYKLTVDTFRLL